MSLTKVDTIALRALAQTKLEPVASNEEVVWLIDHLDAARRLQQELCGQIGKLSQERDVKIAALLSEIEAQKAAMEQSVRIQQNLAKQALLHEQDAKHARLFQFCPIDGDGKTASEISAREMNAQHGERALARVENRIEELRRHVAAYESYCATVNALHDRHGVIDAQCEMRELEARISELERLLT